MLSKSTRRPSPALIVAIVALVAALAGSAIALPGKNTVQSNDIKKNAIKSKHVKKDALKGVDINESKLGTVPSAERANSAGAVDTVQTFNVRAVATETADIADAAVVPLASKGALSLYGKCSHDAGTTEGEVYIQTTQNGAIFESRSGDTLEGGDASTDFLNTDTDETDRGIDDGSTTVADITYDDEEPFFATAPDGTGIHGLVEVATKEGELTDGNGVYGAGNVCLFVGNVIG